MDNHARRVRYVQARYGMSADAASAALALSYHTGVTDEKLTGPQRRRILHKRAGAGAHRRSQRQAAQVREIRRALHWGRPAPQASGELLALVQAGLAKIGLGSRTAPPPDSQPWAEPGADIKGDLAEAGKPAGSQPPVQ